MRTFQCLFFGYPAVLLGAILSLTADDVQTAIAGAGFLISGVIALVHTPQK